MKKAFTILFLLPLLVSAQITVKKTIVCEYRVWYLMYDGTGMDIWGYSNNGGASIKKWTKPAGVTSWSDVVGAFNYLYMLDQSGNVWYTKTFNVDPGDGKYELTTDSAGNAITGVFQITNYSAAQCYIRGSDSAILYGGKDVYSRFYTGGSLVTSSGTSMNYTQLSPGGVHFKKVVMGGTVILGLTGDGLTLYKWTTGSGAPTTYSLVRPAIDVFAGGADFWGVLIPDATGSQTMGYPYVAGSATSLYGGSTTFTTPTSIKTLWNLTQPIKEFNVDWQTIHYIDSSGRLWGCGWNTFGEVGNGQEFVGRYTYSGFPNYGWSFANGENPTGIPVRIDTGTTWAHIYSNNWFGTTKYASKANDSLCSWGRNKGNIMGNGIAMNIWPDGGNIDQYHYNTVDILVPTRVTPISQRTVSYNATPPARSASHNGKFTAGAVQLTGTSTPLKVYATSQPAANGIDTVGYTWTSFAWTVKSGPSGSSFGSASAQTTTVSGLQNGRYVFQIQFNDNHSGIDTAQVLLYVNRINRVGGRIKWK